HRPLRQGREPLQRESGGLTERGLVSGRVGVFPCAHRAILSAASDHAEAGIRRPVDSGGGGDQDDRRPARYDVSMHRTRARGALLLEALVSLAILGFVLAMGAGFLARRRDIERERLDREKALRALASEWVFLRTAPSGELVPRKDVLFVGPGAFVDGLDP